MNTPLPPLKRGIHVLCMMAFLVLIRFAYAGDSAGNAVMLTESPRKVVSLVPAITEIIFRLGAGDSVVGVTYHDTHPPEATQKQIVGGFFAPLPEIIASLEPDAIFISSLHQDIRQRFSSGTCRIIEMEAHSVSDLYDNIRIIGMIFHKSQTAGELVRDIQADLTLISKKVSLLPQNHRKRVIRLMGRDKIMTPGDNSFQNDFIRAAGGIAPQSGKNGNVVEVSLDEWKQFNPQVIYGCGGDRETAAKFFSQPGWKDVEAVQNGKILWFPCELTCRASVNSGYFVSWLAAGIYEEQFASGKNRIFKDKRIRTKALDIPLDYLDFARVDNTLVSDVVNKSLIIGFKKPMRIVSTLEGQRQEILTVGNHYFPPQTWGIAHKLGFDKWKKHIYQVLGKYEKNSSFLFTGADMDNLSVQKTQFRDMTVYALVTAGVEGNALRMSADEGKFYEPGTINIILMSNMKLTPRAMTRAIISATEGKTAAIQDMDIRSSVSPRKHQATGTGTDEIIVVEGSGRRLDVAGGHSKLGELIAKAVYDGVKEAIYRQNGIMTKRNVFKKLQERRINPDSLLTECGCFADKDKAHIAEFEEILLQPRYAAFMESAFALSDSYERGLIADLNSFKMLCRNVSEEIAGHKIENQTDRLVSEDFPVVIRMAVNAILNGILLSEK